MNDLTKATNMIRYNDEIINRPRKEWYASNKQKEEVKEKSKEDLDKERQRALQKREKLKSKIRDSKQNEQKEQQFLMKRAKRQLKHKNKRKVEDKPTHDHKKVKSAFSKDLGTGLKEETKKSTGVYYAK